ncbi:MAG: succinate dehydrogenase iron-sulfur subunit [Spirochaetota bacterium]|nr:succinate dehydrogenase iron-sulfur subunit [Spirochaetota bacterium]
MEVKFKIKRYNPVKGEYYDNHTVNVSPKDTVLNVLLMIRSGTDQSLGFRCSCKSAICGSCAMRINGRGRLACNTQIETVISENNEILVEPAGNQKVIRDLIVDLDMFWNKIKETTPYLQHMGPPPEREYLCSDEDMLHLSEVTECIMCGACVSDCTILEVDKKFMGPAALAKVYRFVFDPRDNIDDSRLSKVSEYGGIWDCTHCFKCIEACPKRVHPMERILSLRKIAMKRGITDNNGSRHSDAITKSVEHSGTLNELMVLPKSFGWWNIKELLSLIPGGIRMWQRNKMPSILHPKLAGVKNIKKIFKKFKSK